MAKRSVTTQVEEKQLRRASRYLKTRRPSETVKAAVDFVAEKAAHEQVVRKHSGLNAANAEAFPASK
jgi:ribosomal protein L31E